MIHRFIRFVAVAAVCVLGVALTIPVSAAPQRLLDRPRENDRSRNNDDRQPRESETVTRTVALPTGGTVTVKNFSGEIRVTPSSGRDVVIKAIRRAPRETLDHVTFEVTTTGSEVRIEANQKDPAWERTHRDNNVVETDMDLQIPATADLDIDAFSSDVTIEGMKGDQRIKTFSGRIDVRGLAGEIEAETFSADINVTMAAAAKGNVSFDSFSGSFDSNLPVTTVGGRLRRNRFEGTLPAGDGPRLRFKTFSGDVALRTQ